MLFKLRPTFRLKHSKSHLLQSRQTPIESLAAYSADRPSVSAFHGPPWQACFAYNIRSWSIVRRPVKPECLMVPLCRGDTFYFPLLFSLISSFPDGPLDRVAAHFTNTLKLIWVIFTSHESVCRCSYLVWTYYEEFETAT